MLTIDDIKHWLVFSKPGDKLVYHTGLLVTDRVGRIIPDVAEYLRYLSDIGKVHLVQKKLKNGVYDYLAVKASRREAS